MEILYMLIGFSLLVATVFLFAFIWAIRNGQYDDSYTPGMRMLFNSKAEERSERSSKTNSDTSTQKNTNT